MSMLELHEPKHVDFDELRVSDCTLPCCIKVSLKQKLSLFRQFINNFDVPRGVFGTLLSIFYLEIFTPEVAKAELRSTGQLVIQKHYSC